MNNLNQQITPNILQVKFTFTFAPKPRTTSRISPMRLKANQDSDIALVIPNILVLSLRITHSSTQSQQNSQYITIFLYFSSNSTTFVKNYQRIGNMKALGTQIKERRKALKITQQELADLAGISINTVVAAERGQGDPKISTYLAICNVLGLKLTAQL